VLSRVTSCRFLSREIRVRSIPVVRKPVCTLRRWASNFALFVGNRAA
jgi:hypothetical protein